MTESVRDTLFSVIRFAMGEGTQPEVPSAEICGELLRVAYRQSILPIVYDTLKQIGAADEVLAPYEIARLKDGYNAIQREDALLRIRAALDGVGIPYVLLKGAVLCRLYPNPDWRTSCDIDVLVPEDRLDDAVRALEERAGFTSPKRNYHDVSMVNDHIHLELHFSVKENMDNIDALLSRVWDYAQPTGEGACAVLSPEFQLFHVLAHMSYHMVHGGLGIRPFLDLWLLSKSTAFDDGLLRQMCANCGILTFYEKTKRLVRCWMKSEPTAPNLVLLENYCLNGGVFGDSESVAASKQREHRGNRYLLHRVFMKRSQLETKYPALKGKPYLLPFYHPPPKFGLLNPEKRKNAQEEIKVVKNMDDESITTFDRLLTDLGL